MKQNGGEVRENEIIKFFEDNAIGHLMFFRESLM